MSKIPTRTQQRRKRELDILVGEDVGAWLKKVRCVLKLTQEEASIITGGGHNGFGRYERGDVLPMRAVVCLFKLLYAHPELLTTLQR